MSGERPNILWYCTDQQRWDTIGALGNPHIRTPRLDADPGAFDNLWQDSAQREMPELVDSASLATILLHNRSVVEPACL